jgi:signal transduction histidine kinase
MGYFKLEEKRDQSRIQALAAFAGLTVWMWHYYYLIQFPEVVDSLALRIGIGLFSFAIYLSSRFHLLSFQNLKVAFSVGMWLFLLNEAFLLFRNPGNTNLLINFLGMGLILTSAAATLTQATALAFFTTAFPLFLNLVQPSYSMHLVLHWFLITGTFQAVLLIHLNSTFRYRRAAAESYRAMEKNAKMATLGAMSAGLVHEINNPLCTLMMRSDQMIELAEKGKSDPVWLGAELAKSKKILERIDKIMQNLSSFSRNSHTDPACPENLKDLVEMTLELCQAKIQKSQVEIELDISSDHAVMCRSTEVSQVLLNLISNACDAVETSKVKKVKISSLVNNNMLEISVEDSGPGVPEDLRKKIMEPFFTTKVAGKGTGIGLSISQKLIVKNRGKLELAPSEHGACFKLSLPMAQLGVLNPSSY